VPSTTFKHPLIWIGVVLFLIAVVGVAASSRSLVWQLQTRLLYTQGTCRVVKAEIVQVSYSYELRVAHEVLIDGRGVGRSEYTEQDTPSYSSREDAEESLRNYAEGSVHPCWYYAPDPTWSSILVDRSMDTAMQIVVLLISLIIGAVGIKLIKGTRSPHEKKV
jgi:hypothetical protein